MSELCRYVPTDTERTSMLSEKCGDGCPWCGPGLKATTEDGAEDAKVKEISGKYAESNFKLQSETIFVQDSWQ